MMEVWLGSRVSLFYTSFFIFDKQMNLRPSFVHAHQQFMRTEECQPPGATSASSLLAIYPTGSLPDPLTIHSLYWQFSQNVN